MLLIQKRIMCGLEIGTEEEKYFGLRPDCMNFTKQNSVRYHKNYDMAAGVTCGHLKNRAQLLNFSIRNLLGRRVKQSRSVRNELRNKTLPQTINNW